MKRLTKAQFNSPEMLTPFGKRRGFELRPYRSGYVVVYRGGGRMVASAVESVLWRIARAAKGER